VGIRADKRSIDGGMTTQPEYAWWSHKKKLGWKLENSGVTPDIYVDNTPNDEVRGRDRQLQVAVKYLLNKLKQDPKRLPKIFPYPNKSIKSFRKRMKRWQAPAAPVRKSNK
jgi:tricorn protease